MMQASVRCVQVVASITDSAAGPSYSVSRLSAELERQGVPVSLLAVDGWRHTITPKAEISAHAHHRAYMQDFARTPGLNRLCLSRDLMNALRRHGADSSVFHGHGLWLMPNIYPAWAAREAGRALVISPRGMLGAQALRFSRLKKVAFWHLLQRSAVRMADCLHATSEQEYHEIRAFGLRNPVAVIGNGVDLPILRAGLPGSDRILLSLGRIHPKKGLDRLLHAWAKVERSFPDWQLKIIGPDELGYTQKLKTLAAQLGLSRLSFAAALYGDAKYAALQNADLFVLPTLNENFGLVVAEALSSGTPVICTKGAPWSGLAVRGCGWWVEPAIEPLAAGLAQAMAIPRQALEEMGLKGRAWMAEAFSWQRAAGEMSKVYRWLAAEDDMPESVLLH